MTLEDMLILATTAQSLYLDGEAGVELQLECQESGQGTPRANIRGVKYVKTQRRRSCSSAHPPCGVFFPFTVQQLGVLTADTIFDVFGRGKKRDEFL